ncbi:membrane dipeptidase [Sinorhizobium sp. 8-89]|uniref:membrane dipeptidase n=1 Tax=Sinorhizobium sp. 7-81 TaxID=3049087 RepID=UPI0024C38694|nr:membrane dipeptidase [Sinorhizobium sp. 7-81]MDK1389507.1 membrane dipeptidase [Sinorhizobium sp. 7-81]
MDKDADKSTKVAEKERGISTIIFDALSIDSLLRNDVAERYLLSGVTATNMSIILEHDWESSIRNLDRALTAIDRSPLLMQATNSSDIYSAQKANKLAVVLGSQGASFLDGHNVDQTHRLRTLARLGLRFFGLVYTSRNLLGDGCGEKLDGGLTFLGEDIIHAANEFPLAIDISHCSHATRLAAAALARVPVCTHSNAFSLVPNPRNVKDECIKTIANRQGVIGVAALPKIVATQNPTIEDLVSHIEYLLSCVGPNHVGLGLDFVEKSNSESLKFPSTSRWRALRPDIFGDVGSFGVNPYPEGISSITSLPALRVRLVERGHPSLVIDQIMGLNWLRVLDQANASGAKA